MTYVLFGASALASGFATREIHNCRSRNDLIHCPDGGYGEFDAREGVRFSVSLTTASLSVYGRQHWSGGFTKQGWKTEVINDLPVILWSGYNLRVGIVDHNVPTYPRRDIIDIKKVL